MAYQKINFSRTAIAGLPAAPAGKRVYYSDTKEPGLTLCITPTGTKSFQVYTKQNGRPVRATLGRFSPSLADSVELPRECTHNHFLASAPELNVRMARSLAALVKIDLRAGINPADTKRAKRDELTLGELFDEYESRHLIPQGRKRIKEVREDFERYLGEMPNTPRKPRGALRVKSPASVNWQHRKISTITKAHVQKLMADLGQVLGKYAANHAHKILCAMFNKAIEWDLFNKENPAAGVPKFKVKSRERFLRADELPRFFASVAEESSEDVREYVLLSLLTGSRKTNVLSMRWADVNLERAEWHLPDTETKNGDSLTIPLLPEAIEILKGRKPEKPVEFVFPGRGASGHLADAKAGWKRILDRDEVNQLTLRIQAAGTAFEWPIIKAKGPKDKSRKIETLTESLARARAVAAELNIDTTGARLSDLRRHDLRRTLGSWQAATGASLVVIGKSLGHKNMASTQIYSRLDIDPVRDAMQTATSAIFAAGGLLPKAEIIPIKKTA